MSTWSLAPHTAADGWDRKHARHLLNRAGFGVPLTAIDELVQLGPEKAVQSLVQYKNYDDTYPEPDWLPKEDAYRELRGRAGADAMMMSEDGKGMQALSAEERQKLRQQLQEEERKAIDRLKVWWILRMVWTPRPLQEKMTLFWHGHFATSAEKVKRAKLNYEINKIFRDGGMGNFVKLVTKVSQSGAMLQYLDNAQNRKQHPNENFARELMELFTLGIGNYTEDDIKEAARAFTGWTDRNGTFVNNVRAHDTGKKTFLGVTGKLDGYDVIQIICESEKMPRFISKKLWEFFVYEDPDPKLVDELAARFRASKFEISALLSAIFQSKEFYSDRAYGQQIKSPAQLLVQTVHSLGLEDKVSDSNRRLVDLTMRSMGQDLFYPPNVKGWEGNRAWINTNTLLVRYNIPAFVVNGEMPNLRKPQALDEVNEGEGMMGMMSMDGETSAAEIANAPPLVRERLKKRQARIEAARKDAARNFKRAPFNATAFFAPYETKTVAEAVDLLVDRFIGRPLEPEQRSVLIAAAGANATAATPFKSLSEVHKRGIVHLLLSTAEYQLC